MQVINQVKDYKIVALDLVRPTEDFEDESDAPSREAGYTQGLIQSHLWIPQVPKYKTLTISNLEPFQHPPAFEPLLNIDFGGDAGTLLALLTRVTVHMSSYACPISGIEFFYSGKESVLYGNNGGVEMLFVLDGPGGERITSVEVITVNPDAGMRGLQVSVPTYCCTWCLFD